MKNTPKDKRLQLLVNQSVKIQESDIFERDALGFYSRILLLCTLPHKNPGDDQTIFGRKTNDIYLGIQSGINGATGKSWGLPYGSYPRLLLAFITTEATKTKNPEIKLGASLSEFMSRLNIVPCGGRWGSITRLKNQINRLFTSRITVQKITNNKHFEGVSGTTFEIADEQNLLWSKSHPDQGILWTSTITLSDKFFNEIIKNPVPIDLDILKTIKQSPLAIDLYMFLTYKTFRLKKTLKLNWKVLHNQFGGEYKEIKNFSRECRKHIKVISELYKDLKYSHDKGHLILYPTSLPSVLPKKYL